MVLSKIHRIRYNQDISCVTRQVHTSQHYLYSTTQIPSRPVRSSQFLARWQGEMERGAAMAIGCRPEPAAVGLNDRAADRQSHAHVLRLGRIKGLEETLKALRIQSRPRILDHDHHTL